MLSLPPYPLCSGKQFQSMKLLQLPEKIDDPGDKEIDGYEAMGRELETKKEVANGSDPVDSYALTGNAIVTLISAKGFRNHNLSVNPSDLE
ncbi:hypothetical protein PG989_002429 [Apiospora arundinis]